MDSTSQIIEESKVVQNEKPKMQFQIENGKVEVYFKLFNNKTAMINISQI